MTVAHYIPWRAIRAGKQLSDSKGASAAISTEAAILAMRRSMAGFLGPRDIFRCLDIDVYMCNMHVDIRIIYIYIRSCRSSCTKARLLFSEGDGGSMYVP